MTNNSTFRTQLQQQQLRLAYFSHLASVAAPDGRLVAGQKVREGIGAGEQLMELTAPAWEAFRQRWASAPQTIWVWSDLHLFHKNISRHAGRPFDNVPYMNSTLLANAQRVQSDDMVLWVGDVSFGDSKQTVQWMAQCPGRHFLVLGNHDVDRAYKKEMVLALGFEGIADCVALTHPTLSALWVTHYPLSKDRIPSHTLNVHGHIHQHVLEGPYANVCVEHTNYAPVKLMSLV